MIVSALTAIVGLFDFFRIRPAHEDFAPSKQTYQPIMVLVIEPYFLVGVRILLVLLKEGTGPFQGQA